MIIFNKKRDIRKSYIPFKCRRTESNCRHKDFQSFALPTELQRQKQCDIYIRFFDVCQVPLTILLSVAIRVNALVS